MSKATLLTPIELVELTHWRVLGLKLDERGDVGNSTTR